MFKHGPYSTETDRKPFFFTLTALFGSLCAALLLFLRGKGEALAVFAGIMFSVLTLAAAFVLLALVTDRAYVEDGVLHMRYLFRSAAVPLDEIGRLRFHEQVYSVFDRKGRLLGTINAQLTGIDRVLHQLDAGGVVFE